MPGPPQHLHFTLTIMNSPSPASPPGLPSAGRLRLSDLYFEEILTAVALVFVVASVTWGVVTRYVSHTPSIWTGEVASIAFAWTVFLGSAAGFRRAEHIIIDVLLNALPPRLATILSQLSRVIVLLVLIAMTVISTRFAITTYDALTTVLRLPQSVVYAGAATGFALMTLRHLQFMIFGLPRNAHQPGEGAAS